MPFLGIGFLTGFRVITFCLLAGFVAGLVVENYAKDHWLEILVWTPVWIIPTWVFLLVIGGIVGCILLVPLTGDH